MDTTIRRSTTAHAAARRHTGSRTVFIVLPPLGTLLNTTTTSSSPSPRRQRSQRKPQQIHETTDIISTDNKQTRVAKSSSGVGSKSGKPGKLKIIGGFVNDFSSSDDDKPPRRPTQKKKDCLDWLSLIKNSQLRRRYCLSRSNRIGENGGYPRSKETRHPLDGLLLINERARNVTLLESLESYLSVRFVISTYSSFAERMNGFQNFKRRTTITPMSRSRMGDKTGLARDGDFACRDYT